MSRSDEFRVETLDTLYDDVLSYEATASKLVGKKESEVRERFGMTPAHYHQVLSAALEHPAAATHPVHGPLVQRILARREAVYKARRGL